MRESLEPQLKRVLWLFLFVPPPHSKLGFLGGSVKNSLAMRETWVRSLEEGTATHSSILAWRIPWRSLASMGSQRVGHNWATKHSSLRVKWTRLQQNRLEKLEWLGETGISFLSDLLIRPASTCVNRKIETWGETIGGSGLKCTPTVWHGKEVSTESIHAGRKYCPGLNHFDTYWEKKF